MGGSVWATSTQMPQQGTGWLDSGSPPLCPAPGMAGLTQAQKPLTLEVKITRASRGWVSH